MRPTPRSTILLAPLLALACASPKSSAPAQDEAAAHAAPPGAEVAAEQPGPEPEADPADEEDAPAPDAAREPKTKDAAGPSPGAGASTAALELAIPAINGGLNRDIIRRIASDHDADVRDCYGRALADATGMRGKIVVKVQLDARGRVSTAELGESSSFANDSVEACVLALVESWSFTDAGGAGSFELSWQAP